MTTVPDDALCPKCDQFKPLHEELELVLWELGFKTWGGPKDCPWCKLRESSKSCPMCHGSGVVFPVLMPRGAIKYCKCEAANGKTS